MPIDFACACGQRFRLADRFAGKLVRCPACRVVVSLPGTRGAGSGAETCEAEVVEDGMPAPFDVLEEYPPPQAAPGPRRSGTQPPAGWNDAVPDEERERPRKRRKRKKVRDPEENAAMAAIYAGQTAEEFMERAEELRKKRKRKDADLDLDGEDAWFWAWARCLEGVKIGGVYITPSVAVGAVMLVTGLICLAIIGVSHWSAWSTAAPKVIIAAILYTLVGAFLLVRSLLFGRED
jgi:hypothetical protein